MTRNDRHLTVEDLTRRDRRRRDRHRRRRLHRHAGPAAGQAAARALLPRQVLDARHRGLQLPARRRRRHEHRRRLRDHLVGPRLRRHGVRPRPRHDPAARRTCRRPRWSSATWSGPTTRRWCSRPATHPQGQQVERAADLGFVALAGTELEFIVFEDTYEEAHDRDYRDLTPANQYNVDYSILGTTRDRAAAARHPQHDVRRRDERRGRQGRVQLRPARDRLPLRRRAGHRRQPRRLQDGRQGDRRRSTASRSRSWRSSTSARATPATSTCRCAARTARSSSGTTRPADARRSTTSFVAGVLATMPDFTLLYAPNINSYKRFADGSFAPTAIAWGEDNRTCAVRLVGHGAGARMENRVPGGDVNPYLALAAMLAGGLHGIEKELRARAAAGGQRLHLRRPEGAPARCARPARPSHGSAIARAALGDEVVDHYTNMADVELAAFDAAVTDWELPPRLRADVRRTAMTDLHRRQPGHRRAGHRGAARLGRGDRRADRARRTRRSRPGATSRRASGPGCCAASPRSSTSTSTSSPSWRCATPATRWATPAGRPATSATS